jgi:uncharacterized membrane protein YphA (DoxX/SURF4 family)
MTSNPPASRNTIVFWVLRVLVAAVFLAAGIMKLVGAPMLVAEFDLVGLGQWFRIVTGILEIGGGILVLVPALSALGAAVLLLVDVGAFIAQVSVIHMDWVHTVVIGALLAVLIYLQRQQIPRTGLT